MFRSFLATLADIRRGRLQDELTQKYGELIDQVRQTGKAGKITLTLSVQPLGKEGTMQQVVADVSVAMPKQQVDPTIFFVSEQGHTLDDPNREDKAPLKDVSAKKAPELREVGTGG